MMEKSLYSTLAIINAIISINRYLSITKRKVSITDPILCYYFIWTIVFTIRVFYKPDTNYHLENYLYEFLLNWFIFGAGIWVAYKFHANNSTNKYFIIDTKIENNIIFGYLISILLFVNIISILVFISIFKRGYPIEALIIDRSYHNYMATEKNLVILTLLGAINFIFFIYYDYLYKLKTVKYIILMFFSIVPFILNSSITAGRTAIVIPLITSVIYYVQRRNICKLTPKVTILTITIILLTLIIFMIYDTGRRSGHIHLPNKENITSLLDYYIAPLDSYEFHKINIYDVLRGYPGYYTFNFIVRNIDKIVSIKYGPAEDFFSLMNTTIKYDNMLYVFVGTMFLEFDYDYGIIYSKLILFIISYIFSILYYDCNHNKFLVHVVCGLFIFQILWSNQIYYLTSNSTFYYFVIIAIGIEIFQKYNKNRKSMAKNRI
ncbi:MAG: O-antigen polymerase [Verrucomicrobiia bacterium]